MQKTHVVMLLDESSSMHPYQGAVVKTFNEYVEGLKAGKRVWLSLFKFAGRSFNRHVIGHAEDLREVFENRKAKDLYRLTGDQYQPNGWTPLYDSIGDLIKRTKNRLPKAAKVLFVIHTDGQENSSKRYNQESIRNLIGKMEKKRGWTFVYLGEGAEAWNAGYDFGVDNVANFSSNLRSQSMDKLATATVGYSCDMSVGGAAGSSKTFYASAGLAPDDIDEKESPSISSVVQNSDKTTGDIVGDNS